MKKGNCAAKENGQLLVKGFDVPARANSFYTPGKQSLGIVGGGGYTDFSETLSFIIHDMMMCMKQDNHQRTTVRADNLFS